MGDTTLRDRFRNMEFRELSPIDATRSIVVAGLAFAGFELICQIVLRRAISGLLKRHGSGTQDKDIGSDATTAITKIVGSVHNMIQVPVALVVLSDAFVASSTIYASSRASAAMVLVSSGYFAYDLLQVLLRFDREGPQYLVHALCCLFVYGYAVYSGFLHYFGAAFLLWELSTPFVHLRWLLFKLGAADSRLYTLNGLAMVAVFLMCRPLWGTYMSYKFFVDTQLELQHPRGSFPPTAIWTYRVANVSLNLLNYFWFYKMASKAAAVLLKGKRSSEVHTGKED